MKIKLLGSTKIEMDGRTLERTDWKNPKALELVVMLALQPEHRLSKQTLIKQLWPIGEESSALFQRHLSYARSLLNSKGQHYLVRDSESDYVLALTEAVEVDVLDFWRNSAPSQPIWVQQQALTLYQGDLLSGMDAPWLDEERQALRSRYQGVLLDAAEHYLQYQQWDRALEQFQRLLENDPDVEIAQAGVLRCLIHKGQWNRAKAYLHSVADKFLLQLLPSAEFHQLIRSFTQVVVNDRASELVGRQRLLEDLGLLIQSQPWVTLTGTGGIGKTTLVRETIQVQQHLNRRIIWLELHDLLEMDGFMARLRQLVGVTQPDIHLLQAALQDIDFVVLDNAEHVQYAAREFCVWLVETCPHLHLLVTSQVPLKHTQEMVLEVPALSTVQAQGLNFVPCEAVQLFAKRASSIHPSFRLNSDNIQAVSSLCQLLEGIPLAIELAAGRIRMLSVHTILATLQQTITVLSGGVFQQVKRHESMESTLNWSLGLLNTPQQRLLHRLAQFPAGCTQEALLQVCADEVITTKDVPHLVKELREYHLVQQDQLEGRIRLLHLFRLHLNTALPNAAFQRRYIAYFLNHVLLHARQSNNSRLLAAEQVNAITEELPNIYTALHWANEFGLDEQTLQFFELRNFWMRTGRLAEARQFIEVSKSSLPTPESHQASTYYLTAGIVMTQTGDAATGKSLLEHSMALEIQFHQPIPLTTLNALAATELYLGNIDRTIELATEIIRLARKEVPQMCLQVALNLRGLYLGQRKYLEALQVLRDVEPVYLELKRHQQLPPMLDALFRQKLAVTLLWNKHLREGQQLLMAVMPELWDPGVPEDQSVLMDAYMMMCICIEAWELAAEFCGAYSQEHEEFDFRPDGLHQQQFLENRSMIEQQLQERFDEHFARGQKLTLEEVHQRMLTVPIIHERTEFPLTAREKQILDILLQEPLISAKQIAKRLSISERTVQKHIQAGIYRKLKVTRRKQLLQLFDSA